MNTRIYAVTDVQGNIRLVRAINAAQALRHVASSMLSVGVAKQNELVDAVTKGVEVEESCGQPEPTNG